eukprot:9698384-Prorocentrum_lima.AAC.1
MGRFLPALHGPINFAVCVMLGLFLCPPHLLAVWHTAILEFHQHDCTSSHGQHSKAGAANRSRPSQ